MPIYEYQCQQCGNQLEVLQKISDPALTVCPSCDAEGLQKLVSAASFRLKGAGWYETDFKSSNRKHLAESDSSQPQESQDASGKGGSEQQNGKPADTAAGSSPQQGKGQTTASAANGSGKKTPAPETSQGRTRGDNTSGKPAGGAGSGTKPAS